MSQKPSEIETHGLRHHSKASEEYIDVTFRYPDRTWNASIPLVYRRTGLELRAEQEITEYVAEVYKECDPKLWPQWKATQDKFWTQEKGGADVTREFFECLASFTWCCTTCDFPPNPNWARRIQDLKEFGYTLATHTSKFCNKCGGNKTHVMLIPLKRGGARGYETWSPTLLARIINLHARYDAYEGKPGVHLLPDHKFPEIRWDGSTRRDSLEHLSDAAILREFQLLSNQRNQQKREVCRNCFQTGKRAYPFAIKFFYAGSDSWPKNTPVIGKDAEAGCVGCGWYDLVAWRKALASRL